MLYFGASFETLPWEAFYMDIFSEQAHGFEKQYIYQQLEEDMDV